MIENINFLGRTFSLVLYVVSWSFSFVLSFVCCIILPLVFFPWFFSSNSFHLPYCIFIISPPFLVGYWGRDNTSVSIV